MIDNLQMRADRLKERPPPPLEMVCWTSLELPWQRIKSFQKFLPWETSQKFEKFLPWEMNQKFQKFFFARTHISAVLLSYHNHTPWFRFWPRLLGANLGGKVLSKTFKKAFQVKKKAFQMENLPQSDACTLWEDPLCNLGDNCRWVGGREPKSTKFKLI